MRKTDDDIQDKLLDCLKGKVEKQTLDALVLMCDGDLQETAKMAQRAIDRSKSATVKEVTFALQGKNTKGDEFEKLMGLHQGSLSRYQQMGLHQGYTGEYAL